MSLARFLRTVVGILDETGVPHMLTGSLAAAYYAAPRATQDVDVAIDVQSDDVQKAELLGVEVSLATFEDVLLSKLEWIRLGDSELQRRDVLQLLERAGRPPGGHARAFEDPSALFNVSLDGNTRRAIDLREGYEMDLAPPGMACGAVRDAPAPNLIRGR